MQCTPCFKGVEKICVEQAIVRKLSSMPDAILSKSTIADHGDVRGKTKVIEQLEDPLLVRIRTLDCLTANDAEIKADLPVAKDKTSQNVCVMSYLKEHGVPVAFVSRNDATTFIAQKCQMLPIEFVVRRRAFGSYLKRHHYATAGDIFDPLHTEMFHKYAVIPPCGIAKTVAAIFEVPRQIPEQRARELYMENGKWTRQIFTDPLITVVDKTTWNLHHAKRPVVDAEPLMSIFPLLKSHELKYIREKIAIPTFTLLEKAWAKVKISLIDLKLEVGYSKKTKEILLADVIDNDSWRIWSDGDPHRDISKQSFRDGEALPTIQQKYRIVTEYVQKF